MEQKHKSYSLEEKEKMADLIEKYKAEYEKEVEENKQKPKVWDNRKKKLVVPSAKKGDFFARTIRELYPSLANCKNEDQKFRKAIMVARRSLDTRENKRKCGDLIDAGSKKKFREPGGGRKSQALEVRQAAFEWFVDVRGSLKGRLPTKIFKAKCIELYQLWLEKQDEEIHVDKQLKFSTFWVKDWMKEYNVSLLKPNKRFAISQEDRVLRIIELIKNVIRVRYYFQYHYKKDPIIINGDQMPLHRNESSSQKTMTQKNQAVYVKENYMLSRERCTVYTQLSTDPKNPMPLPEILFKGKGVRIEVKPPNMNVQFAPKGSYRMENMLKMIENLKNRHHMFSHKEYAIYILDDYSVHLQDEIRKKLLAKGYILVIIGGGITGDIQINDTHLHHQLKAKYRERECELMLKKLRTDPTKIPAPTRDDMMQMLSESWELLNTVDPVMALKNNFILNDLDGSEDHLVSDKLMELVGDEIKKFRTELLLSSPPKTIPELTKSITPPKGVRRKSHTVESDDPPDEGTELIDCEGEEIPVGEDECLSDHEDATEEIIDPSSSSPTVAPNTSTPPATQSHDLPTNTPDGMINADSAFINEIVAVFDKHKGNTSNLFLPYYCQFKDTITKARRSLKKRAASNTGLAQELVTSLAGNIDHIVNEMPEVPSTSTSSSHIEQCFPSTSTSTLTEMDEEEVPPPFDESVIRKRINVGTYVRVESFGQSIPACILNVEPLSVRYFEPVPGQYPLFQSGEVFSVMYEDIKEIINEPELQSAGSRNIFYKFENF